MEAVPFNKIKTSVVKLILDMHVDVPDQPFLWENAYWVTELIVYSPLNFLKPKFYSLEANPENWQRIILVEWC